MDTELTRNMKESLVLRYLFLPPSMALLLHWPAGDWFWVDAWLFIGSLWFGSIFLFIWLLKTNPGLLVERLKGTFQENQSTKDSIIVTITSLIMLLIFPVAGFDRRYQWLVVPDYFKIVGWSLYGLSMLIFFKVFSINSYLSRSIIVQEDRKHVVISEGIYGIIRHPMYFGIILMIIGISLLLTSGAALIPSFISFIFLYLRAISEEDLLLKELEGYDNYQKRVTKRFIPFLL